MNLFVQIWQKFLIMVKSATSSVLSVNYKEKIKILGILFLYFSSGMCSLIDEVVWARLLKVTLGNTSFAATLVISTFMGGLALGALFMSKYADQIKKKLKVYFILELIVTLITLAIPLFLKWIDTFYIWFYQNISNSNELLIFLQVFISALILLIPTVLMGSTLPLIGSYVTKATDKAGHSVGFLYLMNTLGAAVGCFLAGFVLIREFGINGTVYIAAAINLLVAILAWGLYYFYDDKLIVSKSEIITEKKHFFKSATLPQFVLLAAFFTSGFISIGFEIVWMRSIVFYMGGYTFVFSSVLTIYLIGNVIGVWIGTQLAKRLQNPQFTFGISLCILGVLGIFFMWWLSKWSIDYWPSFVKNFSYSSLQATITIRMLAYSFILFILPSIAMGIGFPLALQSWQNQKFAVGKATGMLYGVNTIGAVLGGIVTGFVLIPLANIQISITILGLLGIWTGSLLLTKLELRPSMKKVLIIGLIPSLLTAMVFIIPVDIFKEKIMTSKGKNTIDAIEGINTTVTVHKQNNNLELCSDGVNVAGDNHHRITQKLLGHLGPLINKHSQNVLDIGFGSGETSACLKIHNLQTIECIEIAPELVKMAQKHFSHINLGNELDKYVKMIYMDGKNFLHLTDKKYDIIINDVNIPSYSGSAPLFTTDHFINGKNHLKEHGIFISKLHLLDITPEAFKSITGSFLDVFPHVSIWYPTTMPYEFFYLIGSNEKQLFSPMHVKQQLKIQEVKNSLALVNVHSELEFLSCYIGDENDIRKYIKDYIPNSDAFPYLEFSLDGLNEDASVLFQDFIGKVRTGSIFNHIDWTGFSKEEIKNATSELEKSLQVSSYVLATKFNNNNVENLINISKGLNLFPHHAYLIRLKNNILRNNEKEISKGEANDLISVYENALKDNPDASLLWFVKAFAHAKSGNLKLAYESGLQSISCDPKHHEVHFFMGQLMLSENKVKEAVPFVEKAVQLFPSNNAYYKNLAQLYVKSEQYGKAIDLYNQIYDLNPTNADLGYMLAELYYKVKNKEMAVRMYKKVLQLQPENTNAKQKLQTLGQI